MGELEAEHKRLQQAVTELADDANGNLGRLAGAVRQALAEAQESLATVATPAEMRDFIGQYVGPMVRKPSGDIARKEAATSEAEAVKRSIEGTTPSSIQCLAKSGDFLDVSFAHEYA